jgi:prepilin-type N-terminal cleavage/methylation domain-containing protein
MPGGAGVCFVEDVQMKRRGFTLIELLVVVAIIALLIAILLPSLGKARELANRGTCAANVRGIAQSMHVYGADNEDVYPCVPPPANNSTPSYKLAGAAAADNHYSYSISYPWTPAAISAPGGWWKATSDATIVLMADMSPLQNTPSGANATNVSSPFNATSKLANSIHHQRDGQNVSFGDAHAEFQRSPFVGQNGDNIYTTGLTGPAYPTQGSNPITSSTVIPPWTGGAAGSYDTILVPVANCSNNNRL